MHPLPYVVGIVKRKLGVIKEIRKRAGDQSFKGFDRECITFAALATFHGQLSLVFGEVEQQIKLFPFVKKIISTEEKCRKMTIF